MNTARNIFGGFFRNMRLKQNLTLRRFCELNGLDPGNISKLERGVLPPPMGHDKLEQYARCLGIEPASDEWYSFFDYAAAAAGRIPSDVMSDEEIIRKLPMVFRTLRGDRVSEADIEALINIIRKA